MRPTRRRTTKPRSPSPLSEEDDILSDPESDELDELDDDDLGISDEEPVDDDQEPVDDVEDQEAEEMSYGQLDDGSTMMDSELDDEEEQEQEEEADEEDEDEEEEEDEEDEEEPVFLQKQASKSRKNKSRKRTAMFDSDDENMDEVVQNRPLTKRQRAKLNNETVEDYLELPMESGKKKLLTEEEEALRRSEVARRRKNQSIQRAEKDKEDTINRLLKKQASKSKRVIKDDGEDKEGQAAGTKQQEDRTRLHYVNNKEGSSLSIPMSHTIQEVFGNQPKPQVKGEARCEVEACNNLKKYVTKKTGKKVCSLEHYRLVESA